MIVKISKENESNSRIVPDRDPEKIIVDDPIMIENIVKTKILDFK